MRRICTSCREGKLKLTGHKLTEWDRTRKKTHRARVISKSRVFSERCEVLQCLKSPKCCWHKTSAEIAGQFRGTASWAPLLCTVEAAIRLSCNMCHSCMQFGFRPGRFYGTLSPWDTMSKPTPPTNCSDLQSFTHVVSSIANRRRDQFSCLACARAEKQWKFPWLWKQCKRLNTFLAVTSDDR